LTEKYKEKEKIRVRKKSGGKATKSNLTVVRSDIQGKSALDSYSARMAASALSLDHEFPTNVESCNINRYSGRNRDE
jgi:hypothetical protein